MALLIYPTLSMDDKYNDKVCREGVRRVFVALLVMILSKHIFLLLFLNFSLHFRIGTDDP